MGLFDLLSKDKRDERARARNAQRALNKYSQSVDRMKALEALASDGSEEALYALLRRFGMMYDKTIEDEQEKEWVFEVLCEKGAATLPAIKRYLFSADSISWPLRLLDRVAPSKDEEMTILEEVLARHEPGYERDPTKKMQLLSHLAALKHPRSAALVVPYLKDMDEGVRYTAVEALLRQKNEAVAREPLLELFTSDAEESLRIRLKIAEGFAELGWLVQGFRPGVEKRLPDAFALDREGHIKKKQS
jgi:HEAT repeat protein